ncbi:hypothetical protein K458DRAFT_413973 [Lentithecium fluviatile CBS 122367]|uniref:Rhodopsin domain-containing protein n=1 Tax=Lentithecium fluviatile CBS 122367 TaxID=1168545 RepID=A0A6G1JGX8_9PLEO|nr:hypothetical protein K458DRAFT_413973 [Lentithecium fluviatile CBS 122367]
MAAAEDIPRWMWALADDYPFSAPPKGVIPNFEHPKLVGYHSITIACAISIALLVLFSAARLYSKLRLIRKTRIDDYMFWISLPFLLTTLCLYIYLDNNGAYGYHAYEFKIRELTKPILVVTFLSTLFLPVATTLIKVTLFCLILSAFEPVRKLRFLCYGGIFATVAYYFANLVIIITSCHPREGHDRVSFLAGMASKKCAGTTEIIQMSSIATGVFNVIIDLYIMAVPLPAVAKLNISRKKKIGVAMIFSAGGVAVIASIISLAFRCRSWKSQDLTVDTIPAMACNMVEISVGLMVTCIGPVWKLIRSTLSQHFPSVLGSSKNSNSDPYVGLEPVEKKRKHQRGGLSEIDSMKTFGTTVDFGGDTEANSTKTLTRNDSV